MSLLGTPIVSAHPARLGDLDEDGRPSIHDIVAILNHVYGRSILAEDRVSFADLNRDGLVNLTDVDQMINRVMADLALSEIDFNPSLGPQLLFTGGDQFTVSGSNFPRTGVRVSHDEGSQEVISDLNGALSIDLALPDSEWADLLVFGFAADGARLPAIPVSVRRDTALPEFEVTFPPEGWITGATDVVVCGKVRDGLTGDLGLAIRVGGQPVESCFGNGVNGSFLSAPVALQTGGDSIPVQVIDAVGNLVERTITVNRESVGGFRLAKTGGDLQTAKVGEFLSESVSVRVFGPTGAAIEGKPVQFDVIGGLGQVSEVGGGLDLDSMLALTDATGTAIIASGSVAGIWRMP